MPNLTTSDSVDTFMESADQPAMRAAIGGIPTVEITANILAGDANGNAVATAISPADVLLASNNLALVSDKAIARTNLELGNVANVDSTNASNLTSGVIPSGRYDGSSLGAIINAAAITPFTGNSGGLNFVNGICTGP